jgi:hypothetical protein
MAVRDPVEIEDQVERRGEIGALELGIVAEAIAAETAPEGVAGPQIERSGWKSANAAKEWEFSGQEKTHGLIVDYIGILDERNPAVKSMIAQVMQTAKHTGRKMGPCGQTPSIHSELAQLLVE